MTTTGDRRRFQRLLIAGWIDSVCLSFAWTLVLLDITEEYGLKAAGLAGAAMLIGTAMSAPVATALSARLSGRGVLRTAGGVEAVLRAGVFALLWTDAPVGLLCVCIVAMNVTAWTGYAGMRAEVDAVAPGTAALTLYSTGVYAVEAIGAAAAALVPHDLAASASVGGVLVVAGYVAALVPTLVVAGGTQVAATPITRGRRTLSRPSVPLVAGVVLMFLASGPTLLAVALAAEMFGRSTVAAAAIAFTAGSLLAPLLAHAIQRHAANNPLAWTFCALGMVLLWPFAPVHVTFFCAAQLVSGLTMTALEGLIDSYVAETASSSVTGALARATAGRALGAAAGSAVLPFAIAGAGLMAVGAMLVLALSLGAAAMAGRRLAPRGTPADAEVAVAETVPVAAVS